MTLVTKALEFRLSRSHLSETKDGKERSHINVSLQRKSHSSVSSQNFNRLFRYSYQRKQGYHSQM